MLFSVFLLSSLFENPCFRDASWELEENAFEDLLLRYERCDIIDCKCPEGRTYNRDGRYLRVIKLINLV